VLPPAPPPPPPPQADNVAIAEDIEIDRTVLRNFIRKPTIVTILIL
jgi:hypothetical protein